MIAILSAVLALSGAAASDGWVWTLYEGDGPVVLANEQPDTPNLRATLECQPGAGVVQLALYDVPGGGGFATFRVGSTSATAEAFSRSPGVLRTPVRVDHPVFAAFVRRGSLEVAVGDWSREVALPRADVGKLRRFAELCGG